LAPLRQDFIDACIKQQQCGTRQKTVLMRSAPLPQLLPHLDKSLHLSRAWEPAIDQPAIPVRLFIEVSNCFQAKVSEVVTQLGKVGLAQYFDLLAIRTPSHAKKMLPYSLFVRLSE
jgi:hypothetical protein